MGGTWPSLPGWAWAGAAPLVERDMRARAHLSEDGRNEAAGGSNEGAGFLKDEWVFVREDGWADWGKPGGPHGTFGDVPAACVRQGRRVHVEGGERGGCGVTEDPAHCS